MFIATLCIITKRWKQPKHPSVDKWIEKMWYIPTMEYYSTLKREEILAHGTIWINLENMKLSDISQLQKEKHRLFPLI